MLLEEFSNHRYNSRESSNVCGKSSLIQKIEENKYLTFIIPCLEGNLSEAGLS